MVAGAVEFNSNTLRPALQILKTAPDVKWYLHSLLCVFDCGYGHNGTFCMQTVVLLRIQMQRNYLKLRFAPENI